MEKAIELLDNYTIVQILAMIPALALVLAIIDRIKGKSSDQGDANVWASAIGSMAETISESIKETGKMLKELATTQTKEHAAMVECFNKISTQLDHHNAGADNTRAMIKDLSSKSTLLQERIETQAKDVNKMSDNMGKLTEDISDVRSKMDTLISMLVAIDTKIETGVNLAPEGSAMLGKLLSSVQELETLIVAITPHFKAEKKDEAKTE